MATSTASKRSLRNRREDCIGQSTATTSIIILIFFLFDMPCLATGLEQPGFVSQLKNITIGIGRSTQFTCVTKDLGDFKVKQILPLWMFYIRMLLHKAITTLLGIDPHSISSTIRMSH